MHLVLKSSFLPSANEFLGKVMFLHLSVILFTRTSLSGGFHWQRPLDRESPDIDPPERDRDLWTVTPWTEIPWADTPLDSDPLTVKSGRYASHWNAFLYWPVSGKHCVTLKRSENHCIVRKYAAIFIAVFAFDFTFVLCTNPNKCPIGKRTP